MAIGETDDEKEIIYLALSNLNLHCIEVLESEEIQQSEEDLEMTSYLYNRTLDLITQYESELSKEPIEKPIQRPSWGKK